ncbi:PREDICTED: snRNA-activating protein complex subunit 3 [Crocodylus porosus]|uniref:snRNA-activating protein complex subunit 3 n=1 Tax=Crocodylus porosus TaxID=8502 RepID=UPI00093D8EA7|nr:PREDICTED: snRNA-activating protein complex subunit 3 [Crocodylus porosus]
MAGPGPEYETPELCTRVFPVGAVGALWRERLPAADLSLAQRDGDGDEAAAVVAAELGCPPDTAAELRAVCSIDMLKSPDGEEDAEVIPEDTMLETLRIRKKALDKREESIIIDRPCRTETFIYEMVRFLFFYYKHSPWEPQEPGRHCAALAARNRLRLPRNSCLVLLVLRWILQLQLPMKAYVFLIGFILQGFWHVNVLFCIIKSSLFSLSKDLYKAAFFYFEGVFYNDKRHPECRDLSRTIIEWSKSHDRGYGNLQAVNMEGYTFNDLSLKIGFPYLYCHQGDCEHIVTVTDIRLIHRDDCLDRTRYPLLIKKPWLYTRKCFVCKMYIARWVTNEDSLAPEDPCFFCDVCFRMLHYDAEGNKLGEFLAYPYVDPGTFN